MRTTVHVTPRQVATLLDVSGWAVVPWSPLAACKDADPLDGSAPELAALLANGLLVYDGGRLRANLLVETALAALAEPEVSVEVSVPGAAPLVFCRAGPVVIAWYELDDGRVAFTDAVPVPDLLALLDGLFGVGAATEAVEEMPTRLRVDRSELELLLALAEWQRSHGEGPGFSRIVQVVDDDRLEGDAVDPEALDACLNGLIERGCVAVEGARLVLAGASATLLGGGLEYGFAVKQVRIVDGDVRSRLVTAYRSGDRVVAVQDAGLGPEGEVLFHVWEAPRAQLSAMVLAFTFGEEELASLGSRSQ